MIWNWGKTNSKNKTTTRVQISFHEYPLKLSEVYHQSCTFAVCHRWYKSYTEGTSSLLSFDNNKQYCCDTFWLLFYLCIHLNLPYHNHGKTPMHMLFLFVLSVYGTCWCGTIKFSVISIYKSSRECWDLVKLKNCLIVFFRYTYVLIFVLCTFFIFFSRSSVSGICPALAWYVTSCSLV